MTATDWIQAVGTAAAAVAAGAAVIDAVVANRTASEARDAEKVQASIAEEALRATRRQTDLTAVPHLVMRNPQLSPGRAGRMPRFTATIENGGPTVAYGIILSVAIASERNLDSTDDTTRKQSRREPGLPPGQRLETLGAPMPIETMSEWLAVRLDYYTPLGASVRQDYLFGRTSLRWRLHRITISPEVGPPLRFDLSLGLEADEPEPAPA